MYRYRQSDVDNCGPAVSAVVYQRLCQLWWAWSFHSRHSRQQTGLQSCFHSDVGHEYSTVLLFPLLVLFLFFKFCSCVCLFSTISVHRFWSRTKNDVARVIASHFSVCLSILHRLSVCLRVTVRHQNILVNKFCYIKHTFKGDRRCKLRTLCAVANDAYQRSLIVSIHQDDTLMFCFMDVVRTTAGV